MSGLIEGMTFPFKWLSPSGGSQELSLESNMHGTRSPLREYPNAHYLIDG
jgi:hypothetical protein